MLYGKAYKTLAVICSCMPEKRHDMTLKRFFLCLMFLVFVTEHTDATTLYVSVEGNDKWSGRLSRPNKESTDGPLASLTGARDAIRQLKSRKPLIEPLRVIISEGTYTLSEPFVLTAADSGTKKCPVSYEAAAGTRPIFTGGRFISGFKRGDDNIRQTQIPDILRTECVGAFQASSDDFSHYGP